MIIDSGVQKTAIQSMNFSAALCFFDFWVSCLLLWKDA
jgi:hypothetical protein